MTSRTALKPVQRTLAVALFILGFTSATAERMHAQQAQNPVASTDSGAGVHTPAQSPAATQLSAPKSAPKEIRFAMAHQHAFGWCYGYLVVTQDKVRYEVAQPQANSNHSFDVPRTDIAVRRWAVLGQPQPAIEMKVKGTTYHMRWLSDESEVKTGAASRMAPPISLDPASLIAAIQNPAAALAQGNNPAAVNSGEKNSAAAAPNPGPIGTTAEGRADLPPGMLAGVYAATAGADARPKNSQYVFYADGFVVNSIPQDSMLGFDFNRFNPATNRDHYRVGHYKREGEIVKILWMDQFADPTRPDEIKINETVAHPAMQLGWQVFIPMCRCTGKLLSGMYRWGAPAADQYVQFFPNGTFLDHRTMDQLIIPSRFYEHPRIMQGTYAIQNQTMILNFSDGRRGTLTFIAPKAQENDPTFDWIQFGWHMLFEEGYRARISQF